MPSAVEKTRGPCIILAGAGTGKTHTIVEKIKHIVKERIYDPEKIVCLAFSNEAALSLKRRTLSCLYNDKEPIIKTFHSFCADIVRKHGSKIGVSENFKILQPDDAKIMLHKNLKIPPQNCHKYVEEMSKARDLGIDLNSIDPYFNNSENDEENLEKLKFQYHTLYLKQKNSEEKDALKEKIDNLSRKVQQKKFLQSWKSYEKLKSKKNYQDYADLCQNALKILKLQEIAEFEYVIVDEFQDTNKIQLEILENLAKHGNITIVGDLNQSIYGFRGAYRRNFDEFKEKFNVQKEDIYELAKSHRSPNTILRTAHELIKNNYANKEECFFVTNSKNIEGQPVEIYELKNGREEARKVVELIESSGTPLEEICVLFRTHQQASLVKRLLEEKNIPFTSVAKKSLLKHKTIRAVINYLNIVNSIHEKSRGSEESWWDIFHSEDLSVEEKMKLGQIIRKNREEKCPSEKILEEIEDSGLSAKGKIIVSGVKKRILDLLPKAEKKVEDLITDTYNELGLEPSEDSINKDNLLNLSKFVELAQNYSGVEFTDLPTFLHHLSLLNLLGISVEPYETEKKGVNLMTLHATKGLEYKMVIVTNMAEGRFPAEKKDTSLIPEQFQKNGETENQKAEERRLCYVAFTRAREKLILTYANEYGSRKAGPSVFLNEINYSNSKDIVYKKDLEEKYEEPKNIIEHIPIKTERLSLSPSSLLKFNECQKKYEYKYVYNMPEPTPVSWESMKLGSFLHMIFEKAVRRNLKNENEFNLLVKEFESDPEWTGVDLTEATNIIRVFAERNREKYDKRSKTELFLKATIGGFQFNGYADRIDFHEDGSEIIDYKTGQSSVAAKHRNWQLGFYAIAARQFGKVKKVTLDMLKHEKPMEFEIDENGNAKDINSKRISFNLHEVEKELIETARQIEECYKNGFNACPTEKNCEFCNEWVYNKK